jgi:hypothetical protein
VLYYVEEGGGQADSGASHHLAGCPATLFLLIDFGAFARAFSCYLLCIGNFLCIMSVSLQADNSPITMEE